MLKQTVVAPSLNVSQYYRYDSVNRLELAIENPTNPNASPSAWTCGDTPGQRWCEQYGYSAGGNNNRSVVMRSPELSANLRGEPWTFDSKNRMPEAQGWKYDGRGNLIKNLYPAPETYLFDGESRLGPVLHVRGGCRG